jgi:hypothetical protein
VHRGGDLTLRYEQRSTGVVRLPHAYVESAVELGYATTTARAQGRTADTTHVLTDDTTTREGLYVATSRGRTGTHVYVQNEQLLSLDAERPPVPTLDVTNALVAVLQRDAGERTATELQRDAPTITNSERPRRPMSAAGRPREPARTSPSHRL